MKFPIKPTAKFAIMGRSECGKSHVGKYIQSQFPRVVIFDTLEEYSDGIIVSSFQQFDQVCRMHEHSSNFRIIYRLDPLSPATEKEFSAALHALYEWGDLQIVVEEVQELTTAHGMPAMLKRCILTGRHQGLSLLFTTQRPGELHKTILSQCGHVFTGQLHDQNDVRYVAGFLGQDAQTLINLPPRHFLYFRPGEPINRVELVGKEFKLHPT